ncbi:MAG: SGNH/GDSL hydrolase family protein [Cyanobacteriota bacterium]|nr:SGNH/GDSL hydrolase family protein [Cyanobacteriota bacterium]
MKKQLLTVGIAIFSLFAPIPVKAANFLSEITGIYAFGDSVTDTGNLLSATGGALPPSPFFFNGRFSNGPNWIDELAQSLNLSSPTPFLSGLPPTDGVNFAVGGTTTGFENILDLPGLPALQQQVAAFAAPLQAAGQLADPNGLYIVWGGGNDYLPTTSQTFTPFETPDQTIQNLTVAITALANVGAKHILAVNLPDLGVTPRVLGNDPLFPLSADDPSPSELNDLVQAHNSELLDALASLRQSLPETNLIAYDVNSVFDAAVSDPASFGLTNVTEPCLFTPSCFSDTVQQQQYLFWDGIHPTARGYEIVARGAFETLDQQKRVPEPGSAIGIFAFGFWAIAKGASRSSVNNNRTQ